MTCQDSPPGGVHVFWLSLTFPKDLAVNRSSSTIQINSIARATICFHQKSPHPWSSDHRWGLNFCLLSFATTDTSLPLEAVFNCSDFFCPDPAALILLLWVFCSYSVYSANPDGSAITLRSCRNTLPGTVPLPLKTSSWLFSFQKNILNSLVLIAILPAIRQLLRWLLCLRSPKSAVMIIFLFRKAVVILFQEQLDAF